MRFTFRRRSVRPEDLDAFYREQVVGKNRSPKTVAGYVANVRSYLAFRGKRKDSEELVVEWAMLPTIRGKDPSASTVTIRLASMKAWFRFLRVPDLTSNIDRPRRIIGLPKPVEDLPNVVQQMFADGENDLAYSVLFMAETGLRLAEALSVDVGLEYPPAELLIVGKGRKERIVPLTDDARTSLAMIGGKIPFRRRNYQRMLRRYDFHPHQLRHWLGCDMAEAGADLGDVQEMLGHASPATTRRYMAISTRRVRSALDLRTANRAASEPTPMNRTSP